MNIFLLHPNARKCAQMHCDKHVIKMILEHTQLMYTAVHVTCPEYIEHIENINKVKAYKKTHQNHPCAKWVRQSKNNFMWLLLMTWWLVKEKQFRWGGDHKCRRHLRGLLWAAKNITFPQVKQTQWAIANPYKSMEPVESYRKYYIYDKQHILKWTKRDVPDFILKFEYYNG